MNRILVIEDNKTLADALVKKLSQKLGCEVDVAYKLSEAKLFLKMYKHFIVVTDIHLPDAPNGEVVDFLLEKNARVIVLTANTDKDSRKAMLEKDIVDYVIKNEQSATSVIISSIRRLMQNKNHKVLVVDDSMVFRKQMQMMLENLFITVYTVAHGEEALGMLQTHPEISLVLTDYNMPVMDGMELTLEIRKTKSKTALSIIAISSNEDTEISTLFLKNGANDYIKKPFSHEEFSCRVNNALEAIENINTIKNTQRDFLTGLYNQKYFNLNINNFLEDCINDGNHFSISMIGINSKENVDIVHLSEILKDVLSRKDLVVRFDAEEFCIVIKDTSRDTTQKIMQDIQGEVLNDNSSYTINIGLALYEDNSQEIDEILEGADMMLYKAQQAGENQIIFE